MLLLQVLEQYNTAATITSTTAVPGTTLMLLLQVRQRYNTDAIISTTAVQHCCY